MHRWLVLICFAIGCASQGGGGNQSSGGGGSPATAPSIIIQPTSQTVTEGQMAGFSVIVANNTPLDYQWYKNGVAISGATSSAYTTPPTTLADNGAQFTVMLSNALGSVTSNPAILTVNSPGSTVNISVFPASADLLLGNSQQFTATVTGSVNTSVTWSVNGIPGGNSVIGTITATGLYTAPDSLPIPAAATVTATSQAHPTKSADALVLFTSDTNVTVATNPAGAQSVLAGGTLQLIASVISAGHPSQAVTWSVNGVGGGTSAFGTIISTGPTTATYTAPMTAPSPNVINISALSVADSSKSGSVTVTIGSGGAIVTSAVIGPAGGTVQDTNPASPLFGVRVDVPVGALSQNTLMTIGVVPQPPQIPGLELRGSVADFGPSGLTFNEPVSVTIPSVSTDLATNSELLYYLIGDQAFLVESDPEAEGPQQTIDLSTNRITAPTMHFTNMVSGTKPSAESAVNNAGDSGFDDSLTQAPKVCDCPERKSITQLIIHSTHLKPGTDFVKVVSAALSRSTFTHYFVDRNKGGVVQLLDDSHIANQVLSLSDGTSVNATAIGIEMHSNTDHEASSEPFAPVQLDATVKLAAKLLNKHRIPRDHVFSHSFYAPFVDCSKIPKIKEYGYGLDCAAYIRDHRDPYGSNFSFDAFLDRLLTLYVSKLGEEGAGTVSCTGVEGIPSEPGAANDPKDCSGAIIVPRNPGASAFNAWSRVCPGNGASPCTIELTATPNPGFVFAGWGGACSGTGSCVVTMGTVWMDQDRAGWATFVRPVEITNAFAGSKGSAVFIQTTTWAFTCPPEFGGSVNQLRKEASFPGEDHFLMLPIVFPASLTGSVSGSLMFDSSEVPQTGPCPTEPEFTDAAAVSGSARLVLEDPTTFSAAGTVTAMVQVTPWGPPYFPSIGEADANSAALVTFTVNVPLEYNLFGSLVGYYNENGVLGGGYVSLCGQFSECVVAGGWVGPVALSGQLTPGEYVLRVSTGAQAGAICPSPEYGGCCCSPVSNSSSFNVTFSLRPLP